MKKLICLLLSVMLCVAPVFTACDTTAPDNLTPGIDTDQNVPVTTQGIIMWGYGDNAQKVEFQSMVDALNKSAYAKQIGVRLKMTWNSEDNHNAMMNNGSSKTEGAVDIVFVNDRNFKNWANNGFIDNLGRFTNNAKYKEKLANMWSSIYPRFRYNQDGNTSYEDDPLWGVPVDTSPTALYYNRQAMENAGVIVISVDDETVTAENWEALAKEYKGLTADMAGKTLMELWNADKIEDKFGQKYSTCGNRNWEEKNAGKAETETGGGYAADVLKTRDITVPTKGFYREDSNNNFQTGSTWINPNEAGVTAVVKVFNASIAMNWDETEDLAQLLTLAHNKYTHGRATAGRPSVATTYGYYTEWWFNYGWSVGGDCLQDLTNEGTWTYGLNDWSTNYIVTEAGAGYVGVNTGKEYKAGETLEFLDKLNVTAYGPALDEDGNWLFDEDGNVEFNEGDLLLPTQDGGFEIYNTTTGKSTPLGTNAAKLYTHNSSIRDEVKNNATEDIQKNPNAKFVAIPSTKEAVARYLSNIKMGTMPLPTSFNKSSAIQQFGNGDIGMVVERGYQIGLARTLTAGYNIDWGIAPLPQYKEYEKPLTDDITVKRQGKEGGHSEATALCIAAGSKNKSLAWEVIDWLTSDYYTVKGKTENAGQIFKAEAGYIPNQPTIANSSTFIKEEEKTLNLDIFFDALEYEEAGDWWYLPDNAWINIWASPLNDQVRNGSMEVDTWFTNYSLNCTKELIPYSYFFNSDAFENIFNSHFN